MPLLIRFLAFGLLFASIPARAADDIPKLDLLDPDAKPTTTFGMPAEPDKSFELHFRATVPPKIVFRAWIIDIQDPGTGHAYQVRVDGKIPSPIRWDGFFGPRDRVRASHNYRARITVVTEGKNIESDWLDFNTVLRFEDMSRVAQETYLAAYIIPSGGLYLQSLRGTGVESYHFPILSGELTGAIFDHHRLTMRFETSSHLIQHLEPSSTGYFYSDISFFYSYRIFGLNEQHKANFWRPKYAGKDPHALDSLPPLYEARPEYPYTVDLGVRSFFSVLRGFGGELIDSVVARSYQGFALTGTGEFEWQRYVFRAGLEAGYSVLCGSIATFTGHASATFNGLNFFAPGIQLRYQILSGTAQGDPNDGVSIGAPTVRNQIFTFGLLLNFKL